MLKLIILLLLLLLLLWWLFMLLLLLLLWWWWWLFLYLLLSINHHRGLCVCLLSLPLRGAWLTSHPLLPQPLLTPLCNPLLLLFLLLLLLLLFLLLLLLLLLLFLLLLLLLLASGLSPSAVSCSEVPGSSHWVRVEARDEDCDVARDEWLGRPLSQAAAECFACIFVVKQVHQPCAQVWFGWW